MEVEPFSLKLNAEIAELDEKLSHAVKKQAQLADRALEELDKSRSAVKELHSKVKSIRTKVEDSEKQVKAVCSDITRLDRARTNLQSTMKALTMASKLLTAVDQLEFLTESRQYNDAAKILIVINDLNDYFNSHDAVPKIHEMRASVSRVKDTLTKNVFEDVQAGLGSISDFMCEEGSDSEASFYPSDSQTPKALMGACAVADLLSDSTRRKLRKTLIDNYLKPYEVVFKPSLEDYGERRFAWIIRLLESNRRMIESIFPPSWRMEQMLCLHFCDRTFDQFQQVLEAGQIQVPLMVKTLKKTVEFEQRVTERFKKHVDNAATEYLVDELDADIHIPKNWRGKISLVFQPYMGAFVRVLADSVREQVDNAMVEELAETTNNPSQVTNLKVYSSSATLFQSIKQTMQTMLEYSSHQPFYELCVQFKQRLKSFSDSLEKRARNQSTSTNQVAMSLLCITINTADYMTEEIPALQKTVLRKIDANYHEKIDFDPEKEAFFDCASRSIGLLSKRIVTMNVDPILEQVAKQDWLRFKDPGDQSMFVGELDQVFRTNIPMIHKTMANAIYFRSFCDSLVAAFFKSFQLCIFKMKRVGEDGARQLFVDCSAIEQLLLDIPTLTGGSSKVSGIALSTYNKYVENGMRRHKMLFKILSLQVKLSVAVEDFSRNLGPSASLVLFNQMLDMRGVTKAQDRAQALKLAEEGGVPATVPEDDAAQQVKAMLKEGGATGASTTSASAETFSESASNKLGYNMFGLGSAPSGPPKVGFSQFLAGGLKRPGPPTPPARNN